MHLRRLLVASPAAAVFVTSAGPAPSRADDLTAVRVGVMDALTMRPFFVGVSKGYFRAQRPPRP